MSEIIKEHKGFWNVIFKLARVDLIKTYRGSALGWAWAIIKPSVTIFVYWFAFSIGLRHSNPVGDYPYIVWLVVGIVPWFYISEMLTQGTEAIRKYKHLVTKMNFPVSTICTFVSLSKIFVNICIIGIVLVIYALIGGSIDIYLLQLPFYVLAMLTFFTAWSVMASPLSAISKDFGNLVKSFTTAVFWMSGIMWNPDNIPVDWMRQLLKINPVTYIAEGFRDMFIYKQWFFEKKETIAFIIVLIVMWLLASFVYKSLRKDIPDVL